MIDLRWVAAYHESAHCVAAVVRGQPIYSIRIRDDGSGEFLSVEPTFVPPDWDQKRALEVICDDWRQDGGPEDIDWVKDKTIILLAGPCATARLVGRAVAIEHGANDFLQVRTLISTLPWSQAKQDCAFDCAYERARQLVNRHWAAIGQLATVAYCAGDAIFEPEIRRTVQWCAPKGSASV